MHTCNVWYVTGNPKLFGHIYIHICISVYMHIYICKHTHIYVTGNPNPFVILHISYLHISSYFMSVYMHIYTCKHTHIYITGNPNPFFTTYVLPHLYYLCLTTCKHTHIYIKGNPNPFGQIPGLTDDNGVLLRGTSLPPPPSVQTLTRSLSPSVV